MTDTRQFQETIKGVGSVTLTELDTGIPLHVPTADVTIDLGLERRVQEGKNPIGEIVTMGGTITARRSRMNITFKHFRLDIIQFIFGFRFEKAAVVRRFARQFTLPLSGAIPGVTEGIMGFGMLADQPDSRASIQENGLTKGLIRVPYNESGTLTAYEFMQGPNRILRFDPALAAKQKTVTFVGSANFPGLRHHRSIPVRRGSPPVLLPACRPHPDRSGAPAAPCGHCR